MNLPALTDSLHKESEYKKVTRKINKHFIPKVKKPFETLNFRKTFVKLNEKNMKKLINFMKGFFGKRKHVPLSTWIKK